MPFRDRDWEDFQRDCDFFPAYTDYIFDVDTRPEVNDEPGLHPQIFDAQPLPQPKQRLYGLPPPEQNPLAYDVVRDSFQSRFHVMPGLQHATMLRQESSLESMQPTPCPAPRKLPVALPPNQSRFHTMPGLQPASMLRQDSSMERLRPSPHLSSRIPPTTGSQEKLLRPHEITSDPTYHFVPTQRRMEIDKMIIQAWNIVDSDAVPSQKAQAMGFIKNMSRGAAAKLVQWRASQLQTEPRAEERDHDITDTHAEAPYQRYPTADSRQDVNASHSALPSSHAVHTLTQLPAYMHAHLSRLWSCITILTAPADPAHMATYTQAQHYMARFKQSVPPEGLPWVANVFDAMLGLNSAGRDPLAVLELPGVLEVLREMG